jgi:7-cyano-7-deazaguanine synthase
VATHYRYGLKLIDLTPAFTCIKSHLLKTGGEIPEGHYEAASMTKTVVPGRNSIFISILAGICESMGGGVVGLAVHAGDHAIYPDCRAEYIQSMAKTVVLATEGRVRLWTPFLSANKTEILHMGYGLPQPVPYHLTRTCYKDQPISCGKCGSCQERLEAFRDMAPDGQDPIEYETRAILPKE